ncbi:MAG: DNA polymerase III subunit beta [Gemmataceae bacterium]|nr:DNA polymerase III subunit beta [Gemmataceae bacterium]
MKLRVNREALLEACQSAGAALPNRAVREVLACFRLDAREDSLTLTAFDMELGIRQELRGVEVVRPGSTLLPAAQLTQILRESRAEGVELEAPLTSSDGPDGATATLRCGSTAKFELPQRPVEEFPELPEGTDPKEIVIEGLAGQFREMIRRTLFAIPKKDVTDRYAFKGLLWDTGGGAAGSGPSASLALRLVGTDGKRLALCESAVTVQASPSGVQLHPLVPARAMTLLERVLTHDGEVVRAYLGTNDVRFLTERATIYTTLVQGRFPPYRDILEKTEKAAKIKIPLPLEEFLAAVRQIRVMTDEESRRVDISFRPGVAILEGRGPATGSGHVELALPDFAGPAIHVAFDPDFLVEYLNIARNEVAEPKAEGSRPAADASPSSPLTLELIAADKPALFRFHAGSGGTASSGGSASKWVYLVMPMAVENR